MTKLTTMKFNHTFILLIFFSAILISPAVSGQIKPIAQGNPKFLGCAYSSNQALNFQNYWNQYTPENGGKWGQVEGTRNVMNWGEMDTSYKLAKKYGMLFKEHTLIWGAQQPSWIGGLDTASQRKEIEQWFSLVAAKYPEIDLIDVVNEPMHNAPTGMNNNPNYAPALGGTGKTGWDWIKTSFRMARKYFPKSKLIMNEYSVINSTTETQNYIKIIKILQADSLIDGIGEQAHAFTTAGTSTATLKANLDALGATGLPIYLTEMDVDGATDLIQLKEMQRIFPIFWEHPSVKGITLWGFRVGLWRDNEKAYLINQNGTERPAMTWLKAYVNDTLHLTKSIAISYLNDSASTIIKGTSANMIATVLPSNTTIPKVTWSIYPTDRASIDSNGKLTALVNGNIIVTAIAWDGSGVKATKLITIIDQPTSLIEKLKEGVITVYPNPVVNGNFTVNGIEGIQQIELINLVGKKVIEFNNLNQTSLDIQANVPKGMYILKLFDGKQSACKKILIE
jgi:endo-1,4-beta-xylanase